MAGIYIHIPFCKQACHYCNFHFSTSMRLKNGFLQALLKEITLQNKFLEDKTVDTIYLGGGTPSVLSGNEMNLVMTCIREHFPVNPRAEVTLEANPDDISAETLVAWKACGINRLSIGVQSFFDEDLQWMNRAHSASEAAKSIALAQAAGFYNLSIDLIFGTPHLSDHNWISNLNQAISLSIPHLSCYSLTVEPKTALEKLIRKGQSPAVDPDLQARQFLATTEILRKAGYEQYEISNYSLPGKRSQHNSSYWDGTPYLGLGPSAHSFNGISRQWNIANNALYVESLQKNLVPFDIEILTPAQQLNESIMTSLRRSEGFQLTRGNHPISGRLKDILKTKCKRYVDENLLTETQDALILTDKGKLFADGIAAALFFEEDEVRDFAYAGGSEGI